MAAKTAPVKMLFEYHKITVKTSTNICSGIDIQFFCVVWFDSPLKFCQLKPASILKTYLHNHPTETYFRAYKNRKRTTTLRKPTDHANLHCNKYSSSHIKLGVEQNRALCTIVTNSLY